MNENAKFDIGQVVKHKSLPFRGVIFDVDFKYSNSEEWYERIPLNIRPKKNQPYYHLLAENSEGTHVAYVSEQNLEADESNKPVTHPAVMELFSKFNNNRYTLIQDLSH